MPHAEQARILAGALAGLEAGARDPRILRWLADQASDRGPAPQALPAPAPAILAKASRRMNTKRCQLVCRQRGR